MKTSIPLSTIVWNTKDFYFGVLTKLLDTNVIEWYCTIFHFADDDFSKDHYHLYVIPNGKIDTDQLRKSFEEDNVGGIIRPLPFHKTTNFGDWYLYGLHDVNYLASKGLTRQYHYKKENFLYSSKEMFEFNVANISINKYNLQGIVESAVLADQPWDELVTQKIIPANQLIGYKNIYDSMWRYYHNL